MTGRSPLREVAGYIVGLIVVAAFCAYGFVAVGSKVVFGVDVSFPAAWEATMANLAVAALSVLLDRQLNRKTQDKDAP